MIAYFDTSAIIPLLIDEPNSEPTTTLWTDSTRVVTARLMYAEARAALAQAHRLRRITHSGHRAAKKGLDSLVSQIDHVEVTAALVHQAGQLSEDLSLRGYDAVHLAAAETLADDELVFVTGDHLRRAAAIQLGIHVANLD